MSRASRRDYARLVYAEAMMRQGHHWTNAAESVRQGFENCWVAAGLDAIERLVLLSGDDEADEPGTAKAA